MILHGTLKNKTRDIGFSDRSLITTRHEAEFCPLVHLLYTMVKLSQSSTS